MFSDLLQKYPTLIQEPGTAIVSGSIEVDIGDTYYLKIDFTNFPSSVPVVYDIGERIPRKSDRHTYNDGSLCLTTNAQMDIALTSYANTPLSFLETIVIPFFLNNSFYELNGHYSYGEYPHGPEVSTIHTYYDILGISSAKTALLFVYKRPRFKPNMLCYCGSKKKIKKCNDHYSRYLKFRKIKVSTLNSDFTYILKYVELLNNKDISNGNPQIVESLLQRRDKF